MVLVALPLLFWLFVFFILIICEYPWRISFLSASIIWGVIITIITEFTSLFHAINFGYILSIWLLLNIGLLIVHINIWRRKKQNIIKHNFHGSIPHYLMILLCGVGLIVGVVGLIAIIAPPNNWDSMDYHMSRVVHWMQNHSIAHYPTSYTPQLYQNPWSEFAIMHFQILSGGDYFANLVQWFSLVGCILGVSLIAQELGADLKGQVFATVFTATIPMGILQASSTQNDYVISFWIVCLAYWVLRIVRQGKNTTWNHYFFLGSSLGLAILTKGTAYFYIFPFLLWVFFSQIRYLKGQVWKPSLIVGILTLSLNSSHYLRNYNLFASPLGEPSTYRNEVFGINIMFSNVLRNIALHIGTPIGFFNGKSNKIIQIIHTFIGVDVSDARTTFSGNFFVPGGWPTLGLTGNENSAGNLVHLLLILLCMIAFWQIKKIQKSYMIVYIFSVIGTFLLFCYLVKWQPWNSRLHLPLFVLFSPFIGIVLSNISQRRMAMFMAFVLIFSSFTWTFYNRYRPIIAHNNIFTVSRIEQYFSNRPYFKEPYTEAIDLLNIKNCSHIGLSLGNDPWEYPFWVLMKKTKGKSFQMQHINVANSSAIREKQQPYKDFEPCGIIYMETKKSKQIQQQEINFKDKIFERTWESNNLAVFIEN